MDLSLLKEYIEGKWTATEFRWIMEEDELLCNYIRKIYAKTIGAEEYNIIPYIMGLNFSNKENIDMLDNIIERILNSCGLIYKKAKKEENKSADLELSEIILPYLDNDILAEKYVTENILNKIPKGLTKSQQKKYCKNRQQELFRYISKPPQWIQNGEWQYDGDTGQPLVFSKSYKKDVDSVAYVFINDKNNVSTEIIQFY